MKLLYFVFCLISPLLVFSQQQVDLISADAIKKNKVKSCTEWNIKDSFPGITVFYDTNGFQTHYFFYNLTTNKEGKTTKELSGKRVFSYSKENLLIHNNMFIVKYQDTVLELNNSIKFHYDSFGKKIKRESFGSKPFDSTNFVIDYFYTGDKLDSILSYSKRITHLQEGKPIMGMVKVSSECFFYKQDTTIIKKYENFFLTDSVVSFKEMNTTINRVYTNGKQLKSNSRIVKDYLDRTIEIYNKTPLLHYELKRLYCKDDLLDCIIHKDLNSNNVNQWNFTYEYY